MAAPTQAKLEALAKKIHDESEKAQLRIFSQKGYAGYAITSWENTKDGYYKQNVYKLAQKRLNLKGKKQ